MFMLLCHSWDLGLTVTLQHSGPKHLQHGTNLHVNAQKSSHAIHSVKENWRETGWQKFHFPSSCMEVAALVSLSFTAKVVQNLMVKALFFPTLKSLRH